MTHRLERIPFIKAEANGNDFLLVPATAVAPALRPAVARELCDRRCGLGADGVEWWRYNPRRRELHLALHNADGSPAEISGNGTRCAVAWCARRFRVDTMTVLTAAGTKSAKRLASPPRLSAAHPARQDEIWIELNMGVPRFRAEEMPASVAGAELERGLILAARGRDWPVTALSVGNPQACVLVEAFPEDWADVAAALGRHPAFPQQANVEFVRRVNAHAIAIRIRERGAGVTPSSGTGSCAAAIAAIRAGQAESPVEVIAPGGAQEVAWAGDGHAVWLRGPARIIASGYACAPAAGDGR
jgi:diaminopimelate epimerase